MAMSDVDTSAVTKGRAMVLETFNVLRAYGEPPRICSDAATVGEALVKELDATRDALKDARADLTAARAEVERLQGLFRSVAPIVNAATWTKATRPLADELQAIIRAALAGEPGHD
jgi:hypothetical protein